MPKGSKKSRSFTYGGSYSDADRAQRLDVPLERRVRSRSGGSANINSSKLHKTSGKKRSHSHSNRKPSKSAQPSIVVKREPGKKEDAKEAMKDLLNRHYSVEKDQKSSDLTEKTSLKSKENECCCCDCCSSCCIL